MMNTFISGERQYDFVSKFNYVREAGTCGEPQETMVVGDSLKNDILPAHSLGCASAWLQGSSVNPPQ